MIDDVMQVTFAILDFHDGRKTLKVIVKTWTEPVDCCLINLKKNCQETFKNSQLNYKLCFREEKTRGIKYVYFCFIQQTAAIKYNSNQDLIFFLYTCFLALQFLKGYVYVLQQKT